MNDAGQRWVFWGMLAVGIGLPVLAWPEPGEIRPEETSASEVPWIFQARQVIQLTPAQAAEHRPVRLRGVVTCLETRGSLLFIQDQTAGIYIYDPNPPPALKRGHFIEVQGLSSSGLNVPVVTATNILILGEKPLPAAKPITASRLVSGAEDSQWVEMEAIVRQEGEDWGHWLLQLASGQYRFPARILDLSNASKRSWVDARLKIRGVAAAHYNSHRQLTGFHLIVPSVTDLTVLTPPPKDPFALPLHLGREVQAYTPEGIFGHRIRVRGVVTLFQPGKRLFLQDASGGLRLETVQTNQLELGEVVDAAGFPVPGTSAPWLENAIYRPAGTTTPPQPIRFPPDEAALESYENQLVELEGQLLDLDQVQEGHQVLLARVGKGKELVHALLPQPALGGRPFYEPRGSLLRLAGVAARQSGGSQPRFVLWLRSPSDIHVLQRPHLWTLSRALGGLGILGTLLLVVLAWIRAMRHQVRQQTALLREGEKVLEERYRDLFENANDIIYSLDLEGRFKSINHAGEQVLGYGRQEIQALSLGQMAAPGSQERLAVLLDQARQGPSPSRCELEVTAKDGSRVMLEVNLRLDYLDGRPCGIRGIARDITARKRAEEALSRGERQLRQFIAERTRLGRDLHDGIIQSIYGVGLGIEDCRQLLKEQPELAETRLKKALGALNRVIREVRRYIGELEPEAFPGPQLSVALQQMAASMEGSQTARVCWQIDPQVADQLNSIQATQFLHIVREGLSNSLRHAQAESVRIFLGRHGPGARLEIEDHGMGFDVQNLESQGYGLRNMAARALEMGATLQVDSQPGRGTRVTLTLTHLDDHERSRTETNPIVAG